MSFFVKAVRDEPAVRVDEDIGVVGNHRMRGSP